MFEQVTGIDENKMLDKLYDMIKTSLSIGKVGNRLELLRNFEKVTKDIDQRENNRYLQDVKDKFYATTSLDDERKRLSSLIVCITDRNNQKNKLKRDYELVTGQALNDLPTILYLDNLDEYKERFNIICSYLDNEDEIDTIRKELDFLSNQLEKEIEVKRNCELVNAKLEEKLLNSFKNIIAGNRYYTSLSTRDVEEELKQIEKDVKEKEEKLNAFILAYESIKNESITSNDKMDEYSSYILDIKDIYYNCAKKLVFLKTYKLVMDIKATTDEIYQKRLTIKKILEELTALKMKLKIDEPNLLFDFYMLVKEQDVKVSNSMDNVRKINQIKEKIEFYKNKVEMLELEQSNDKLNEILREYGLIESEKKEEINEVVADDSSPFEDFSLNGALIDNFNFEIPKDLIVEKPKIYLHNAIKEIRDVAIQMNMGLVRKKANLVISRVSSRLGINKEIITPIINPKVEEVTAVAESSPIIQKSIVHETKTSNSNGDIHTKNVNIYNVAGVNNGITNSNVPLSSKKDIPYITNEYTPVKEEMKPEPLEMPEIEYSSFWNNTNNVISDNNVNNNNNNNNSDEMPILPE